MPAFTVGTLPDGVEVIQPVAHLIHTPKFDTLAWNPEDLLAPFGMGFHLFGSLRLLITPTLSAAVRVPTRAFGPSGGVSALSVVYRAAGN